MTTAQTVDQEQIGQTIIDILKTIAPEADFEGLDPDANIQEALDIDSFDFLNLLIGLDENLGVSIPESDYARVGTFNGLVRYLAEQL